MPQDVGFCCSSDARIGSTEVPRPGRNLSRHKRRASEHTLQQARDCPLTAWLLAVARVKGLHETPRFLLGVCEACDPGCRGAGLGFPLLPWLPAPTASPVLPPGLSRGPRQRTRVASSWGAPPAASRSRPGVTLSSQSRSLCSAVRKLRVLVGRRAIRHRRLLPPQWSEAARLWLLGISTPGKGVSFRPRWLQGAGSQCLRAQPKGTFALRTGEARPG